MSSIESEEKSWGFIALFGVLFIVIAFRVWDIEIRPLHHDEAVNFHFVQEIFKKGYYPYSHENYHGPSYFYLLAGFVHFLGDSVLSFRGSSILCGILVCLVPFLILRPFFTKKSDVVAVLPLALSSSLVFHSRYAIHEIMLLLFSLGMAAYAYRFFSEKNITFAGAAALCAAGCFATKETTLVVGFGLFVTCLLFFGIVPLFRLLSKFLQEGGGWLVLSVVATVLLFTGALQWSNGMREFVLAFAQWISRGVEDTGHFKPWYYYLKVLWQSEPILYASFLIPIFALFEKGRSVLGGRWKLSSFFSVWALLLLIIHSFIPYKMPWIVIQWTGPMCVALGIVLADWMGILAEPNTEIDSEVTDLEVAGRRTSTEKIAKIGFLVLIVFVQAVYGVLYNFTYPYQKKNPFSYVHTSPGLIETKDIIIESFREFPKSRVLIAVNSYWPLPYYLREFAGSRVDYGSVRDFSKYGKKYGLYLLEKKVGEKVVEDECIRKQYFRLSDVEETYLVTDRCYLDGKGKKK